MGEKRVRVRSIAAGAGTGKTTELTRVIREGIINGQCRPNAIIGTTFTIKAAGEFVERVRQEFFKSGQVELGERLTESLLGTVDSVCLRLLTRFAFEAGIFPRHSNHCRDGGQSLAGQRNRRLLFAFGDPND
jgi:ATP-dependent helicase/nuclease subunit A